MKIRIIIFFLLTIKNTNSCRMSEIINFKPIPKKILSPKLQEAEKCFDGIITIKQNIKNILYLILTHISISEMSKQLLDITQNIRIMLDTCKGVNIYDFLNYLKENLNQDGKLCLKNLNKIFSVIFKIFIIDSIHTPIEEILGDLKELWGVSKNSYYYCKRINFDIRI